MGPTVLSIDGGGIRGIKPAMELAEIEKRTGKKCHELFDVIAGTSIGSLIGGGLSTKFSAQELVDMWEDDANYVFRPNILRKIFTLNGMRYPRWSTYRLERVLREKYGEALLKDCKTELVVPAFDTANAKEWHFERNIAQKEDSDQSDLKVSDIVIASSSAPGYFRPYQWKNSSFIDGAVYAPNPTDIAYSVAEKLYPHPEDSFVLSLGTGKKIKRVSYADGRKMGFANWVLCGDIIQTMGKSNGENTHLNMKRMLPEDNYVRWQYDLDHDVDMDDANDVRYMKEKTETFIEDHDDEIREVCNKLDKASEKREDR